MAYHPGRPDMAVLANDPASRAHLRAALEPLGDVHLATSTSALLDAVASHPVRAIVIEPRDGTGRTSAPLVWRLRREFPSAPILVYCGLTAEHVRVLPQLAQAGADRLIIRGIDDVGTTVRQILARSAADRVRIDTLRELNGLVPPDEAPVLAYCLTNAYRPLAVREVARGLGLHRKTLCNRARAASFPPPSEVISWCRLLHAARLLNDSGRSVEQVALVLGFGSGTALRNMLRRYTRRTPTELRRGDVFGIVLSLLRDRIASRTVAAKGSRVPRRERQTGTALRR